MERIAVIEGVRSPMGKMGGALAKVQADNLGAHVIKEVIAKAGFDKSLIDEVIVGNVGQPPHAMNLARVAALKAGIDKSVPAVTVHRNCASGMESVTIAGDRIRGGDGKIFIAAGVESMSNIPFLFNEGGKQFFMRLATAKTTGAKLKALLGFKPRYFKPTIGLELGLNDIVSGLNMGQTAEVLAKEFKISRREQDEYASRSHNRAEASREKLKEEIVPIVGDLRTGKVVSSDEGIRLGQTPEALAKLKPYFDRKHGTVTAGNSSQITDGASAMIIMGESKAKELGLKPIGYVSEWAYAGLDPARMGLGPVYATKALLKKIGGNLDQFDLVEMNEAFAAQVLACLKSFEKEGMGTVSVDKLNVNGGAIALGHPVGMTGNRLIVSLLHELRRQGKKRGLVTVCVGGGQGAALLVETE